MAAKVRLKRWRGKECERAVISQEARRLSKAALHYVNKVKQNISSKGSRCGQNTGGRSAPGDFPSIECGTLRNSITYELNAKKLKAVAGTNLKHGKFLELGTKTMAPRPFLRPTLAAEVSKIRNILIGKKLKGF